MKVPSIVIALSLPIAFAAASCAEGTDDAFFSEEWPPDGEVAVHAETGKGSDADSADLGVQDRHFGNTDTHYARSNHHYQPSSNHNLISRTHFSTSDIHKVNSTVYDDGQPVAEPGPPPEDPDPQPGPKPTPEKLPHDAPRHSGDSDYHYSNSHQQRHTAASDQY